MGYSFGRLLNINCFLSLEGNLHERNGENSKLVTAKQFNSLQPVKLKIFSFQVIKFNMIELTNYDK